MNELAGQIIEAACQKAIRITTAESCTGGMVAATLTDIAGASQVFERGFVTYSNQAKTDLLGVSPALLQEKGAVSKEVALAMATGAREKADADIAVSITGIAGPKGGSREKPVGLVHIAAASKEGTLHKECHFSGTRLKIRQESVEAALALLNQLLS